MATTDERLSCSTSLYAEIAVTCLGVGVEDAPELSE